MARNNRSLKSCESSDGDDALACRGAVVRDAVLGTLRLNQIAVAVIDSDMAGVHDDVARLRLIDAADRGSLGSPAAGSDISAAVVARVLQNLVHEV